MKKITCSVVIPVFNSENTVATVVEKTKKVLDSYAPLEFYEIILVNDGSADGSASICKALSETMHVCFINFTKNFGQHHALLCGFKEAKGDIVIKVDDDLQIIPEEIPKMIDALIETKADVAFAMYNDKKHSSFRNFGSSVNNWMAKVLLEKPKDISVSNFYLMRRYVVNSIVTYTNPYPYIAGLIFRATDNIINVPVKHAERKVGKSNYTIKKLLKLWINGFVNFSVKPLRVATLLGTILSLLGVVGIVVLMIRRLLDSSIQLGWTSIMASVIFFGGIQLLSLGLIGEYVGRIFISINRFPQYVVKEKHDGRR